MKLYIYDHCPFCVRARMAAALRGMVVEEVVLLSDDEATPLAMIGVKQLPVLQKSEGVYMGESLDIVHFLDGLADGIRLRREVRLQVQEWLDRVSAYAGKLLFPRCIGLGLPEFATQAAIDYFVAKKEQTAGNFADLMAQTGEYLRQLDADLAEADALLRSEQFADGIGAGMEDILLFPVLRNLTMVEGAVFAPKTRAYLENMATRCGVALYFDRAC
ncbi:MAG: glutaredoxin 2 [Neisseria sp.]|nr:glutaredoxin 2 [Neisseria sp.]